MNLYKYFMVRLQTCISRLYIVLTILIIYIYYVCLYSHMLQPLEPSRHILHSHNGRSIQPPFEWSQIQTVSLGFTINYDIFTLNQLSPSPPYNKTPSPQASRTGILTAPHSCQPGQGEGDANPGSKTHGPQSVQRTARLGRGEGDANPEVRNPNSRTPPIRFQPVRLRWASIP